jgi:hypothetical protein
MTYLAIDTLSVAKRLKSKGFSETQAEAIAFEMQDATKEDHLVTKSYLDEKLEKVDHKLEKLELHLTIRFGVMLAALAGILLTAVKLMFGA